MRKTAEIRGPLGTWYLNLKLKEIKTKIWANFLNKKKKREVFLDLRFLIVGRRKSMASSSSTTTTTTATVSTEEDSERRDSSNCYFPDCRKDANCTCEICLDSLNATLDLMPLSVQRSSLTKLSYASSNFKPTVESTPTSFDPDVVVTTPASVSRPISRVISQPKKKVAKKPKENEEPTKKRAAILSINQKSYSLLFYFL